MDSESAVGRLSQVELMERSVVESLLLALGSSVFCVVRRTVDRQEGFTEIFPHSLAGRPAIAT